MSTPQQRELRCAEMDGTGNAFVVVDAVTQPLELAEAQLGGFLGALSAARGCDQTLLLLPPTAADIDFSLRMFNADGGEVEQCGNGARCIIRFVIEQGLASGPKLTVNNLAGDFCGQLLPAGQVRAQLPVPTHPAAEPRKGSDSHPPFHPVSLGNPHAVIFVDELAGEPADTAQAVAAFGTAMQQHPDYPHGANVGLAQIRDRGHVSLQIYERGVGVTQACGSAAAAAVIAGQRRGLLNVAVQVAMPGGDVLVERPSDASDTVALTGDTQLRGHFIHYY